MSLSLSIRQGNCFSLALCTHSSIILHSSLVTLSVRRSIGLYVSTCSFACLIFWDAYWVNCPIYAFFHLREHFNCLPPYIYSLIAYLPDFLCVRFSVYFCTSPLESPSQVCLFYQLVYRPSIRSLLFIYVSRNQSNCLSPSTCTSLFRSVRLYVCLFIRELVCIFVCLFTYSCISLSA